MASTVATDQVTLTVNGQRSGGPEGRRVPRRPSEGAIAGTEQAVERICGCALGRAAAGSKAQPSIEAIKRTGRWL